MAFSSSSSSSPARSSLRSSTVFLVLVISLSFFVQFSLVTAAPSGGVHEQESEERAVHIVYTERREEGEPESNHIQTLISILGSEEAARDALIYSYKSAASGFSANLTPKQVEEISKLPGVLHVVPSGTISLD